VAPENKNLISATSARISGIRVRAELEHDIKPHVAHGN
jgi:hypothetical protein